MSDTESLRPLSSKFLESILMCCQPALLARLRECEDDAEVDLTESWQPWPRILASFPDRAKIDKIVGTGIVPFTITVDPNRICPYQDCPQLHSVMLRFRREHVPVPLIEEDGLR